MSQRTEILRYLADQIRNRPQAREEIAHAIRIIADAMDGKPCTDCASQQGQQLHPDDNPEAGTDTTAGGV